MPPASQDRITMVVRVDPYGNPLSDLVLHQDASSATAEPVSAFEDRQPCALECITVELVAVSHFREVVGIDVGIDDLGFRLKPVPRL